METNIEITDPPLLESPEDVTYSPSGKYRMDYYGDYWNCVRVADGEVVYTRNLDQSDGDCFFFQHVGSDWLMVTGLYTGMSGGFHGNPDLRIGVYDNTMFLELDTGIGYDQPSEFSDWYPHKIYSNPDGTILAIPCHCRYAHTSKIVFLNFQNPRAWSTIPIRESIYYPVARTEQFTWLSPTEATAEYEHYTLLLTYSDEIMHSRVLDQTDFFRQTIAERKVVDSDMELYREMIKQSHPYFKALYEAFPPEHDPPRDKFDFYLHLPRHLKLGVDPSIPHRESDYQYYTWDCPPEEAPFEYTIHRFRTVLIYKNGKIKGYDSVEACIADIRAKYETKIAPKTTL